MKLYIYFFLVFFIIFNSKVYSKGDAFIKVLISSKQNKAIFLFSKGFIVQDENNKRYIYNFSTLNIKCSSNNFILLGKVIRARKLKIFSKNNTFQFNGKKYRGSIFLLKSGKYSFHIINVLNMEEYIYGVLKSEMLSTSPFQALCAQAIVARTWGIRNIGRHSAEGYDVCNTTHCQVYGGMNAESKITNKAVDYTKHIVLKEKGHFINAVYHCNCGGHTANNEDIWNGKPLDYLRGVKCPYCINGNHYIWSLKVKTSIFNQKMIKYFSISNIRKIKITRRTSAGFVLKLNIITQNRNFNISGNDFRRAMGSKILPSSKFFFSKKPKEKNSLNNILNDLSMNSKNKKYDPIKEIINKYENKYEDQNNEEYLVLNSKYVYFSGYGFGHGLGLCQEGACGMADEGYSYREILYHYYGKNIIFDKIK